MAEYALQALEFGITPKQFDAMDIRETAAMIAFIDIKAKRNEQQQKRANQGKGKRRK